MIENAVTPEVSEEKTTARQFDNGKYVYEIRAEDAECIHSLLDLHNLWIEVARKMGYSEIDIVKFKSISQIKNRSPTDVLIANWGDQNHTATELFMLLYSMSQYGAMAYLKNYVDQSYHQLILKKQPILEILLDNQKAKNNQHQEITSNSNSDGCPIENIDDFKQKIEMQASTVPNVPYCKLTESTNGWDDRKRLGSGGFGSVFKGKWKFSDVAIKRMQFKSETDSNMKERVEFEQSLNELRYLLRCSHNNILQLFGYSTDGPFPCLIYQFQCGGSLEHRLRNKSKPLTIEERKKIAYGTAAGLQHLHTFRPDYPLIHCDIKPGNILLDAACEAKIGDFGFVRKGSFEPKKVDKVYGTLAYVPNEYRYEKILSTKVDAYSYGVVLFELVTKLPARFVPPGQTHDQMLADYMRSLYEKKEFDEFRSLIDKTIPVDDYTMDLYSKILSVGIRCTAIKAEDRPEMVQILQTFENYMESTQ